MIKATEILSKVLWLYAGALIPVSLAKLTIIDLDGQTNIMTAVLVFLLIGSIYLFLLVLGF